MPPFPCIFLFLVKCGSSQARELQAGFTPSLWYPLCVASLNFPHLSVPCLPIVNALSLPPFSVLKRIPPFLNFIYSPASYNLVSTPLFNSTITAVQKVWCRLTTKRKGHSLVFTLLDIPVTCDASTWQAGSPPTFSFSSSPQTCLWEGDHPQDSTLVLLYLSSLETRIQCLSFCNWRISCSIMSSRFYRTPLIWWIWNPQIHRIKEWNNGCLGPGQGEMGGPYSVGTDFLCSSARWISSRDLLGNTVPVATNTALHP